MNISIDDWNLTSTAMNVIFVTIVLVVFFIVVGITIRKADPSKPSRGFLLVLELIFTGITKSAKDQIGELAPRFEPYIITVGSYLILANLLGLVGLKPPTIDINVTFALATLTLVYIMVSGVVAKGIRRYLKDVYIGPASAAPVVIKQFIIFITIISELSKMVSLSFRLFGNVVSGALLLFLFVTMLPIWTLPILPALNVYFDIFTGLIQAMIFCILMMMWLRTAAQDSSNNNGGI